MAPRTVFVAVPILGRPRPEIDQVLSFLQGQPKKGVRFTTLRVVDCYPRHFAFNTIAAFFLQSKADDLWLIEHDMVCPRETLQILDMEEDVCAARYINLSQEMKVGAPLRLMAFDRVKDGPEAGMYRPLDPLQAGVRRVDAVGFGCTLIRGRVMQAALTDPRMRLPQDGLTDQDAPNIFQAPSKINGQQIGTEDLDFCGRAVAAGFSIAVNLDVRCGHFKEIDLGELERTTVMVKLAVLAAQAQKLVGAVAP